MRGPRPVTIDDFTRAESDRYFAATVERSGGRLGVFDHGREIASVDDQPVVRFNHDVLLSVAVFDLDAGPVTITLPDPGERFLSILVTSQDHYNPIAEFGGGTYRIDRDAVGTRYGRVALRLFVDPGDPDDLAAAHAIQDLVSVEQPGGPGALEVPDWDQTGLTKIRDALLVLGTTLPDSSRAFGRREDVNPVRHLIATAIGWGGNPESGAKYINVNPPDNDGNTPYRLHVENVPVDGFWSISLYNREGYFQKNPSGAYNINSVTATKIADGSVDVQFGACDATTPNCLPIMDGWNYTVRLYRPHPEILNGQWTFPKAEPVG